MASSSNARAGSSSRSQSTSNSNIIKQSDSASSTPLLTSPDPSSSNAHQTPDASSMTVGQYIPPSNAAAAAAFLQDLNFPLDMHQNGALAGVGIGGVGDEDGADDTALWNFTTPGGGNATFPFVGGNQVDESGGGGGSSSNGPAMPSHGALFSSNPLFPNGDNNADSETPPADLHAPPTSHLSTSRPAGSQLPTHVAKNNPFLNKLRSMVDDPKTNELIRWSDDGETFLVPNHVRFGDEVLPRFFKHNRFSSFVRQLNMYGFHKVPHLQQGALKSDPGQDTELWEFRNDNFKRDRPELLLQMQRKKGVRIEDEAKESTGSSGKGKESEPVTNGPITLDAINGALTRAQRGEGDSGLMQLASVWSAIKAIQSAQQGINDNLRHLHNTNNDLWREAAEQRSRSKKQEETINKMLRFLAGIFGAQDVNNIGGSSHHHRHSEGQASTSSSGSSNGQGVIRQHGDNRRRLLIGNGSSPGGQIEELEVPPDEVEENDATPQARITEARSGTNSPANGDSPEMHLDDLPNVGASNVKNLQNGLPSISSEATSTPGGGRRISQQAGAQLLNALASGEAQSWLANLFGQQQQQAAGTNNSSGAAAAQSQSARTQNDNLNSAATGNNSFKLDAQTLAALQGILGAGAGAGVGADGEGASGHGGGYFDDVGNNRFEKDRQQRNGNANANANANPNLQWAASSALSPRTQPNTLAEQSQLARLAPQQQQTQNLSQDAAAVQNALNALVQSLRIENNGNVGTGAATQNAQGHHQGNGALSGANQSATTPSGSSTTNPAPPSGEVDMDSLLKEFFHDPPSSEVTSYDEGSMTNGVGDGAGEGDLDEFSGQTPAFAFSPAPAAEKQEEQASPALQAGKNALSSRKRKPDDDDGVVDWHAQSSGAPATKIKATRQGGAATAAQRS